MRRNASRIALFFAGAAVGLSALSASADSPIDQGWWTVTNPGATAAAPAVAPPDVPPDGLLVQGGAPGAPVAFAGLLFEPAPGSTAKQLVLSVAPQSATTPAAVLQLCPLTAAVLDAQQGGPMADAPAYDCTRSVSASPDAAGTSYAFDLKALASGGTLAVAVLPTSSSDRVVFSAPGPGSLVTTAPQPTYSLEPGVAEPEPVGADPVPAPLAAPLPAPGTAELPSAVASVAPAPVVGVPQPSVAAAPSSAPVLASVTPSTASGSTPADHHGPAGAALLGLLALSAFLWASAGRGPTPELPDV